MFYLLIIHVRVHHSLIKYMHMHICTGRKRAGTMIHIWIQLPLRAQISRHPQRRSNSFVARTYTFAYTLICIFIIHIQVYTYTVLIYVYICTNTSYSSVSIKTEDIHVRVHHEANIRTNRKYKPTHILFIV